MVLQNPPIIYTHPVYLSVLSSFYESKLIAVGHLHRAEKVLKFHGAVRSGNIAHVGSGVGGCRLSEVSQLSSQD